MTQQALPKQFGRYHIERELGRGGMGAVYLARDTMTAQHVALKVPHFGEKAPAKLIERFLREARVAASVQHPNLCSVFDVGQFEGIHYLTMPYIEGTPLSKQIDPERPWSEANAAQLIRKLTQALGVFHDKGLIHRDLKPGNILLRSDSEPIIMDFGLARSFDDLHEKLTQTGKAMGSPAYMAPEQVAGARRQMGPATDVYALGVILFELLTGCVPFRGSLAIVYGRILHAPAPLPSAVREGVSPQVDEICQRCLAKDPRQRYASMAELATALTELLGDNKVVIDPPVPEEHSSGVVLVSCRFCAKDLKLSARDPDRQVRCPACRRMLGTLTELQTPTVASTQQSTMTSTTQRPTKRTQLDTPLPVSRRVERHPQIVSLPLLVASAVGVGLLLLASIGAGFAIWWAQREPAARHLGEGPIPVAPTEPTEVQREPIAKLPGQPPTPAPEPKPPPTPGLSILPLGALKLQAGKQQELVVRVERSHCDGPVKVHLEGLPVGVRAGPQVIAPDSTEAQVTLMVAPSIASGRHEITVTAEAGKVMARQRVTLDVQAAPPPPQLTLLPLKAVSLVAGDRNQSEQTLQVRIRRENCPGVVSLQWVGLPEAVTTKPLSIEEGAQEAQLTLRVDPRAEAGRHVVRLQAKAPGATAEGTLTLTITQALPGNLANSRLVEMKTNYGTVHIQLYPDKTPITVKNFLAYVDARFYDNTIFHRVIKNFMNQGGGYSPGMKEKKTRGGIKNESKMGPSNKRGTISMARTAKPDSATAQFFINVKDNSAFLDAKPNSAGYTVFGKVIKGMDVIDKINKVATGSRGFHKDVPVKDVIIHSIRRVKE